MFRLLEHQKPSRSKPDNARSWCDKYNIILQSWSFQSKQHCSVTARDSWFHRPSSSSWLCSGMTWKKWRRRQSSCGWAQTTATGTDWRDAADAATNEIDHYLSLRVPAEFEDDPLRFWEKYQSSFPILSVVARVYPWNECNFCPSGVYVQYNRNRPNFQRQEIEHRFHKTELQSFHSR